MYPFIKQAAIQAVATWPAEKNAPRTLRIANAVADLQTPPSYEEYLRGEFFARDWVLSGANPSTILLERPLIVLERDLVSLESPYSKSSCTKLWVSVLDTLCKDCNETPDEATRRMVQTLHRFILRMTSFKAWQKSGGDSNSTLYEVNVHKPSNDFVLFKDRIFKDEPIKIIPNPRLVTDSGYAASVQLEYCECLTNQEQFVPFHSPLPIGESICEAC
jgi:hypothetical protein